MFDLSIIIVNYKTEQLLKNCIESIYRETTNINFEIIVVDNDSQDNSEKIVKEINKNIQFYQMGYNSGFARANNYAIKKAKGEYVLLLNSDIIVKEKDTIKDCVNYLKEFPDSKNTILGIRLTNIDGTYQETLRLDFSGLKKIIRANPFYIYILNRILRQNNYLKEKDIQKKAHYKSGKVAWINGAFLLINRITILEKELFFDPDFFLYGEDIEWCWRANKKGMTFYHWYQKELVHIGSASRPSDFLKRCQITVSDWLMIKKTRGFIYYVLYLIFEIFNLILDNILHSFAIVRRKNMCGYIEQEVKYKKVLWYLIKKYGLLILLNYKISNFNSFYTNCYEDKFLTKTK